MVWTAILIASLAAASSGPDGGTWVVDRLIAAVPEAAPEKTPGGSETVGRKPITESELEFEARVALIRQGAMGAATAPLDDDVLAHVLDFVIGQDLALLEIQRLKIEEPDPKEVASQLKSFADHFPSPAAYRAFLSLYDPSDPRAGEDALAAILSRDLRVSRYLDRRVRLLAHVDEAEVKKYIADHPAEVASLDRQLAIEAVRARLTRDRAAEITRREMDAIRERHRYEVQLIAPLARRTRAAEPSSRADLPDGGWRSEPRWMP